MANFLARLFGTKNTRELKRMGRLVQRINDLEPQFDAETDLAAHTAALRERLAAGETLDELLPEAFAAVREAAKRTKGMRHFDVQLIGGITLHEGRIAEMRTGEGKTLMATLPAYLNALPCKGVHVVTVNDYLAKRDALPLKRAAQQRHRLRVERVEGDDVGERRGDSILRIGVEMAYDADLFRR